MSQFKVYEEIMSQPDTWKLIINNFNEKKKEIKNFLKDKDTFIFTGCGSGHNASVFAKNISEYFLQKDCYDYQASEISFFSKEIFSKGINKSIATFLFSRSGNTTEIIDALTKIKNNKISSTFGITCFENSFLYKNSDFAFSLADAGENAIATTRSLTSMDLLSILIQNAISSTVDLDEDIKKLPDIGNSVIKKFEKLSQRIGEDPNINRYFILSNLPNFGIARESKLKLLEMTLSWADCFNSFDFRHGPKAVINKDALVIMILSDRSKDYELELAKEMKDLGANLLILGDFVPEKFYSLSENIVDINIGMSEWIRGILFLPIIQLICYYKAIKKGMDPDNPKNLSYFVEIK